MPIQLGHFSAVEHNECRDGITVESYSVEVVGLSPSYVARVGWQVTLCDPLWQMAHCCSAMSSHQELYTAFKVV